MDVTAEGYLYSSFNAGAEAGETPEQIRERLGNDIEAACAAAEGAADSESEGCWCMERRLIKKTVMTGITHRKCI